MSLMVAAMPSTSTSTSPYSAWATSLTCSKKAATRASPSFWA